VILIDEYDKPIIDYLDDPEKAKSQRNILKTFYSIIKDSDQYLRMLFITGVSKFSKASIFSELNNLQELSLHPRYASFLGYTQQELETSFEERIDHLAPNFGGRAAFLELIRHWYNGYTWDGTNHVYNPFSILNFFDAGVFLNFWFESGTPTFLIKLLRKTKLYDMESIKSASAAFGSYELDNISPETLLFQTGYITIKEDLGFGLFELGYPNQEVRESMLQYLLADYTQQGQGRASAPALLMAHALVKGDVTELRAHINAMLGSIPYELHQKNEAYYHTVMHLAFSLIGVHIQSEIHVAKGRLDCIVQTEQHIYIFEFKVNRTAQEAIHQIQENKYAEPYKNIGKTITIIGVNFNTDLKEVDDWLIETIPLST
ncbi:MAG: AAA family ATPase, partial [Flammeovirgaceae bacterium]